LEYIRTFSHDDSFWERDADNASGKKYKDPDDGGTALEWFEGVLGTLVEAFSY